jgi:hypothetical protein
LTHVTWNSAQNPIDVAAKAACFRISRAETDWYILAGADDGRNGASLGGGFACLGRSGEGGGEVGDAWKKLPDDPSRGITGIAPGDASAPRAVAGGIAGWRWRPCAPLDDECEESGE